MVRFTPVSHTLNRLGFSDWMDDIFVNDGFKLDVKKTNNHYLVIAELPGFKKEDIQISYEKDTLTIHASVSDEKEENNESWIHQERRHRSMKRSIYIPDLDDKAITARLKDGLLHIEAVIQTTVASPIQIETE
jgi:HSP20 family protein